MTNDGGNNGDNNGSGASREKMACVVPAKY